MFSFGIVMADVSGKVKMGSYFSGRTKKMLAMRSKVKVYCFIPSLTAENKCVTLPTVTINSFMFKE